MNEKILAYTGERMLPEQADEQTLWEHIHRYKFAIPYVKGKRVLDIACGEGYGSSAIMKAGATKVIGVDISKDTCYYAKAKYKIDVLLGSAERIPLADNSVDVIVSFETIEHLQDPEEFLQESLRILTFDGLLIVSTPNRLLFDSRGENNFHVSEMSKHEFVKIISKYYPKFKLFGQIPVVQDLLSIYALCSQKIPSNHIRGSWRLSQLRNKVLRKIIMRNIENARLHANTVILEQDSLISKCLNPYVVRPVVSNNTDFVFYIAVAKK